MANQSLPHTVRGCQSCRAAHAKCDTQLPSCGRCVFLKRECTRGLPFLFRHANSPGKVSKSKAAESQADFEYADDQTWVSHPNNVEFILEHPMSEDQDELVDEEDDIDALGNADLSAVLGDPKDSSDSTILARLITTDLPAALSLESPSISVPITSSHQLPPFSPQPFCTSPDLAQWMQAASDASPSAYIHLGIVSPCLSTTPPSSIIPSPKRWPLVDENEVILLRYFVSNLSSWFDYCDPHNTFATLVPRRAITSPPLLYAILATSARHLSLTNPDHDSLTAESYHRKCLALLIPILNDDSAALDEALFAATVILRLYEEISVPVAGQDHESHLLGTHTFVRAQGYSHPSAIQEAAFLVVLRQEIALTFRVQRPVQLLQKYVQVNDTLDRDDDWASTFQIIVLCAEVLSVCYGDGPKPAELWTALENRVHSWMDNKPVTFEPLLYREPDQLQEGKVFPEIWLLNDCHVAAHTHYLICRILLGAYDPRKPQLGPGRARAVEESNNVIRGHVREVCGMALSNAHSLASMFTACIVIAICGDLFTDFREQKAMYDILVHTDVELAWPTRDIQKNLRQSWGWQNE